MVKSQGVEAYLVRHEDNYRYPEHAPPPTSGTAPDTSAMAYVEVVTHDRYEIVIVFTAEFDFKGAHDVKITWETDNRRLYKTYSAASVRDAIDRTGQDETRVSSRPSLLEYEWSDKWVDCGLFFADLQIGTTSHKYVGDPVADQTQMQKRSRHPTKCHMTLTPSARSRSRSSVVRWAPRNFMFLSRLSCLLPHRRM